MARIRRFDHVGITVSDLDVAAGFFVELGFGVEGRTFLEGEFLDTVVGIPDCRAEMVLLRPPDDTTRLELTKFIRPEHAPGSPAAMATRLGISNVSFEVDDLDSILDRLAVRGYVPIGGVGEYENVWRMTAVRGPDGIIVNLAQRFDAKGVE